MRAENRRLAKVLAAAVHAAEQFGEEVAESAASPAEAARAGYERNSRPAVPSPAGRNSWPGW